MYKPPHIIDSYSYANVDNVKDTGFSYIPLANIPAELSMAESIPMRNKNTLVQIYIGSVSILGFIILYKYFERS